MLTLIAHHALFAVNAALTAPLVALSEWLPTGPANPEFDPSHEDIASAWRRMRAEPVALERPVVVLAGYRAWPVMADALAGQLRRLTSHRAEDVLSISYTMRGRMDEVVRLALGRIEKRWPTDGAWTREVDVVGISMGGLVARRAAMDRGDGGKRLRIARLFTLASPHGGARLAQWIRPDPCACDMRPGSPFLGRLDEAWEGPGAEDGPAAMYPYAVVNDTWVGASRTMPPGCGALWTRGSLVASHFTISANRRVVGDIALRLRGDEPWAKGASQPPHD